MDNLKEFSKDDVERQPKELIVKHEGKDFASSFPQLSSLGLSFESIKHLGEADNSASIYEFTYGHADELSRFFDGRMDAVAAFLMKCSVQFENSSIDLVKSRVGQVISRVREKYRWRNNPKRFKHNAVTYECYINTPFATATKGPGKHPDLKQLTPAEQSVILEKPSPDVAVKSSMASSTEKTASGYPVYCSSHENYGHALSYDLEPIKPAFAAESLHLAAMEGKDGSTSESTFGISSSPLPSSLYIIPKRSSAENSLVIMNSGGFTSSFPLLASLGLTLQSTATLSRSDYADQTRYPFTDGYINELLRFFSGKVDTVVDVLLHHRVGLENAEKETVRRRLQAILPALRLKNKSRDTVTDTSTMTTDFSSYLEKPYKADPADKCTVVPPPKETLVPTSYTFHFTTEVNSSDDEEEESQSESLQPQSSAPDLSAVTADCAELQQIDVLPNKVLDKRTLRKSSRLQSRMEVENGLPDLAPGEMVWHSDAAALKYSLKNQVQFLAEENAKLKLRVEAMEATRADKARRLKAAEMRLSRFEKSREKSQKPVCVVVKELIPTSMPAVSYPVQSNQPAENPIAQKELRVMKNSRNQLHYQLKRLKKAHKELRIEHEKLKKESLTLSRKNQRLERQCRILSEDDAYNFDERLRKKLLWIKSPGRRYHENFRSLISKLHRNYGVASTKMSQMLDEIFRTMLSVDLVGLPSKTSVLAMIKEAAVSEKDQIDKTIHEVLETASGDRGSVSSGSDS
ncbi:uncharacterized protein LOC129597940 [Paramacrobiotus metropolitanus]|uniref:uncharacterized protein LOC129597940 n=1 Tax=Paramacrobiotus metropolitanus TaxID=2943436 RepID=UPI0024458B3B|nr:uncharacterized protein LOC129597940 [Paramacrobiotus metropolitanus]